MLKHVNENVLFANNAQYNTKTKKIERKNLTRINVSELITKALLKPGFSFGAPREEEVKIKRIVYDKYIIYYNNNEVFYDKSKLDKI